MRTGDGIVDTDTDAAIPTDASNQCLLGICHGGLR